MSIVKVIMMQKNEGNHLARWLAHYSTIFGIRNLFIFDNGSDDPFTLSLLHEAEYHGAHIERNLTTPEDWQHKGQHFTSIIEALDRDELYDFALPVDCDEILCIFTENGLSLDRRDILAEFERLKLHRCAFSMNFSLFNVPQQSGWYAPNRHFPKGFVPARCNALIDDGHHFPTSREQPNSITTRLTYLHHHNRPYAEMVHKARQKLALEVDVDDPEKLKEHARHARPGGHLVRVLLQSEEEYQSLYNKEVQLFFDGNGIILKTPQGLHFWDSARYLTHHSDVRGYLPGPLSHYLMYGFSEGRKLA